MNQKNNLELFKNEIIYGLEHGIYDTLFVAMVDVYNRETGGATIAYRNVLDWFLDVPRETLELDEFTFHYIQEYYSTIVGNDSDNKYDSPISRYCGLETLLRMNIIPSKYAEMPINKFVRIIRLKKVKK